MTACCCIDVDDPVQFAHTREVARARKAHVCCECRRTIPVGAPYRYEAAVADGDWQHYHTCRLCASVRDDRFACGFCWGFLWEHLRDCLGWVGCDCEDPCDCESWLDPPDWPIEVNKSKPRRKEWKATVAER